VGDGDEADAGLIVDALSFAGRQPRRRRPLRPFAALALAAGLCAPALAEDLPAGAALAVEMGCFNCHGKGPRRDAPGFPELAAEFARHRGDPQAAARIGAELREGEPFHARIVAHEQMSAGTATKLMQWIIDGAPQGAR